MPKTIILPHWIINAVNTERDTGPRSKKSEKQARTLSEHVANARTKKQRKPIIAILAQSTVSQWSQFMAQCFFMAVGTSSLFHEGLQPSKAKLKEFAEHPARARFEREVVKVLERKKPKTKKS